MFYPRFAIPALLVFSIFLASCGSMKAPDFRSVEQVEVGRVGSKKTTVRLGLRYFNPNKSRLKLKKASGEAWVENQLLGHFIIDSLIHIPAGQEFLLPVTLQVDMGQLLKNSMNLLLKKEVNVRLGGTARVGKGIFFINYPIRYEGLQDVSKFLPK